MSIADRADGLLTSFGLGGIKLPWIMFQGWRTLGFLSWRIPASKLAPHVPAPLTLDTFEGDAFVTLVPMHMVDVHLRGLPPLPFENTFPELNVRTYVKHGDRSGVYFFRIYAAAELAAFIARFAFHLPYVDATMSINESASGEVTFSSELKAAKLALRYRGVGPVATPLPGTLESFLTDRASAFAVNGSEVLRGDIAHAGWPLQNAEVEITTNTIASALGLPLEGAPTNVHFSPGTDTVAYPFVEDAR